jgi:hypothetical protein
MDEYRIDEQEEHDDVVAPDFTAGNDMLLDFPIDTSIKKRNAAPEFSEIVSNQENGRAANQEQRYCEDDGDWCSHSRTRCCHVADNY